MQTALTALITQNVTVTQVNLFFSVSFNKPTVQAVGFFHTQQSSQKNGDLLTFNKNVVAVSELRCHFKLQNATVFNVAPPPDGPSATE
ncbi:hypothetical protein [Duganella vulcania]|uniref:hypothetical protein n=1 Tax=Duganella vulcania TaxID=2692166 RepID=UPI001583EA51|nr:hypothetical protein [Duganella vulcania]